MAEVVSRGATLYYETYGQGEPLVLVAGYGGAGTYWNAQIEGLSKHFRLIIVDHRGTGRSERDTNIRYSVDQMADDVIAVLDDAGVQKAHFIGHSLGGLIGQSLGVRYQERFHSLVLYGSFATVDDWKRRVLQMRVELLRNAGPDAFAAATTIYLYPWWWINENKEFLNELEQSSAAACPPLSIIEGRTQALFEFDMTDQLSRIEIPVLVLGTRDDWLCPYANSEELHRYLPGAQLQSIEDGGHASNQVRVEEFNRVVLEFLRSCAD